MKLEDYTTDELIQELSNRTDVWAVKVWMRKDVEAWLDTNLEFYDNEEHNLESQRETIIRHALGCSANLDDACEADWATIECYMADLLRSDFGAHIRC